MSQKLAYELDSRWECRRQTVERCQMQFHSVASARKETNCCHVSDIIDEQHWQNSRDRQHILCDTRTAKWLNGQRSGQMVRIGWTR